jgi:exodeoxyribonuclease VII large subunit
LVYPVPVQGVGAAERIAETIRLASDRRDCDVLILARGGGSLEDLMAFNDEGVAHAIRASMIPVLTGIGHEIDLSIADLAADRRAPTPSAAAELAVPSAADLAQRIGGLDRRLASAMGARGQAARRRLDDAHRRLLHRHPAARLEQLAQTTDRLRQRLEQAIRWRLERRRAALQRLRSGLLGAAPQRRLRERRVHLQALRQRLHAGARQGLQRRRQGLATAAARLQALSPLAVLQRGYAIAMRAADGTVLRRAREVAAGETVDVRLAEGQLRARVLDTRSGETDTSEGRAS